MLTTQSLLFHMSVVRHVPSPPAAARSMVAAKTRSTHPGMIGRRNATAEAGGGIITETCRITASRIDDYDPSFYRLRSPVDQLNAFFVYLTVLSTLLFPLKYHPDASILHPSQTAAGSRTRIDDSNIYWYCQPRTRH